MGLFRKTEPKLVSPVIVDPGEEIRVTSPHPNGGFGVEFKRITSEELCKDTLDPRLFTLEHCVQNNIFIDPGQVSSMLNASDVCDIEELSGRVSEDAYNYLKENLKSFDFNTNTPIVEPNESKKS